MSQSGLDAEVENIILQRAYEVKNVTDDDI